MHLSRWISTHGYALNVDLDPAPFTEWITACGLEDASFTSLAQELGRPVTLDEVRPAARDALAEVFELELEELPGDEPGLWAQPLHAQLARALTRSGSGRRAQPVEHDGEVAPPRVRVGRLPRRLDRGADEQRHVLGADVARARRRSPARARSAAATSACSSAFDSATSGLDARPSPSQSARSAANVSPACQTNSRNASPASGRSSASAANATSASTRLQTTAAISESLVGKRRKTVACPTPARRAISSTLTSGAALGEGLRRRLEHALEVALSVGAERRRHAIGTGAGSAEICATSSFRSSTSSSTSPASTNAARSGERPVEAVRRAPRRRVAADGFAAARPRSSRGSRARARRRSAATC